MNIADRNCILVRSDSKVLIQQQVLFGMQSAIRWRTFCLRQNAKVYSQLFFLKFIYNFFYQTGKEHLKKNFSN